jgi:protein MpaA
MDSVIVEGKAARAVGAPRPFRVIAGALPTTVDTCRPMTLEAMAPGGPARRSVRVEWGLPTPASAACGSRYMDRLAERIWGVAEDLMSTARRALSDVPPGVAGRSWRGRPVHIRRYGESGLDDEVLVFGCIHGDECAAQAVRPRFGGCPARGLALQVVRNLNPDGLALGTRLNGRGVDLNRNFPEDWKPIGRRGSPQYSGPRPFSEPESRLAARIIRRLTPKTTIWFHQHDGPAFVRAWGPSVPAARRFADLAGMAFRRMPWLAGTAPNWQNNTFPGTSSFVVELPYGKAPPQRLTELGYAMALLARETNGSGGA